MTATTAADAAYIIAALMFIRALAGLSQHETAKAGNNFGIAGMTVALLATVALAVDRNISGLGFALLLVTTVIGATIGLWRARVVEMTQMPELIALFHSFVGLAALMVGWNGYLSVENKLHGAEALSFKALGTLGIHHAEGVHRCVHRRGHVHRLGDRVPQAVRADQLQAADAARQERVEHRRAGGVRWADGLAGRRPPRGSFSTTTR
jgi:NAD(P) transhydrogenase beta subunit